MGITTSNNTCLCLAYAHICFSAHHRGSLECSIPKARLARIDFVFVCHGSAIHASMTALAASNIVCVLDVNFQITFSIQVQRYYFIIYFHHFVLFNCNFTYSLQKIVFLLLFPNLLS